ncbi:hypothetical protein HHI36_011094 [Cryptolaemus montrouzieri]|uniref:Glycerol-3-phosphate phosphatase n=1 Tax=Cryptolaemus montrouzieri TaxID=559131 RepID=A0ABD2ML24_9CUCU
MYYLSCTNLLNLSKQAFWRYLHTFDTVLTSCEGVLWNDDREIKGSAATLNRLREIGKQIFFITNNSRRTREEVVRHAEKMGFIIHKNEVISSSYLIAYYLTEMKFSGTVYVVGSRGLVEELNAVGIKHIGTGPDIAIGTIPEVYDNVYIDPSVTAVVVGLDEHFSYVKIIKASTYLQNPNCEFLAASFEERRSGFIPKVFPATGAILTAIETCSGRKAKILGKPGVFLAEYLTRRHCVDSQRSLFIGDRLRVDMLLGYRCNFQTLLVLSGLTKREDLNRKRRSITSETKAEDILLPNLYTKALEDILPYLILK